MLYFAFFLVIVYAGLSVKFGYDAYNYSFKGKESLEQGLQLLEAGELSKSRGFIEQAHVEFKQARKNVLKAYGWRILPWLGTQIKTVNLLLHAGVKLTQALAETTILGDDILKELSAKEKLSYSGISTEDKRRILGKVADSQDEIEKIKSDIDEAITYLDDLPDKGVNKRLALKIQPIKEQLPNLKLLADKILPLVISLPKLAGYPDEVTYLVLLQNNDELRPTGGFIGTYGVLKVSNGDITFFQTDNVYNLDDTAKDLKIEPPHPLRKYVKATYWYFRDSNWSPDFPTAAEQAQWFYRQEGGKVPEFDGVLAMTPTYMGVLLKILGPQKVDGVTFTSENIADALENRVGKEFFTLGIPEPERKSIVGKLGLQVKEEILKMPLAQLAKVFEGTIASLDQKQFLIYSKSPQVMAQLNKNNWSGRVRPAEGDFVFVVDTNLASLKTDHVIDRHLDYEVYPKDGHWIAKLILNYRNNGHFTWKTSRLRSWTRVYVPKGSKLIQQQGLMDMDRSPKPGQVETGEEYDKTYFAGFIAVEPGHTESLTFEYQLPDDLMHKMTTKGYSLLVQKQAGTHSPKLDIKLNFDAKIKDFSPLGFNTRRENPNTVIFSTDLTTDREFRANF